MPDVEGRPTKFTQETRDKILQGISKGLTFELACNYAGVTYRVYRYWMKDAEEKIKLGISPDSDSFVQFFHDVKRAEGERALGWLDVIEKASVKEWCAAAWLLERCARQHFGKDAEQLTEIKELIGQLIKKGETQNDEELDEGCR